jgi:methyltransferase
MELSVIAFLALLLASAALRFFELGISKRHRAELAGRGAQRVPDPGFPWMVALHTAVLAGAAAEVVFLHRPWIAGLGCPMFALFVLCNALRWWVMRTLGVRWSVNVVDPSPVGIVSAGPFRFVRHPNYTAVWLEMLALPLIHTAWITALAGSIAHIFLLRQRVRLEDGVLLANPAYRATMGNKARFVPGIF